MRWWKLTADRIDVCTTEPFEKLAESAGDLQNLGWIVPFQPIENGSEMAVSLRIHRFSDWTLLGIPPEVRAESLVIHVSVEQVLRYHTLVREDDDLQAAVE